MFSLGSGSSMANNKGKEIVEEEQDGNNGSPWLLPPPEVLEAKEALEWLKKGGEIMEEAEEEQDGMLQAEEAPDWLQVLMRARFWRGCKVHRSTLRRAEKCVFCVHCFKIICPQCRHTDDKPTHRLLKIRRYVYRSVVSASDMNRLGVDVSYIQTYKSNGHNVVHLRPIRRSPRHRPSPHAPRCMTCDCLLHTSPNRLCSLTCKHRRRREASAAAPDDISGRMASLRLGRQEAQHVATSRAQDAATSRPAGRRPRKQAMPKRAPFF